jgi:hypothetical protein
MLLMLSIYFLLSVYILLRHECLLVYSLSMQVIDQYERKQAIHELHFEEYEPTEVHRDH